MNLEIFRKILDRFNVLRGWKLILCLFVFLLFIVLFVDGYVFWQYQRELSREVDVGEVEFLTIKRDSLQKVLDEINIKERKFKENLVAPAIKDPAL